MHPLRTRPVFTLLTVLLAGCGDDDGDSGDGGATGDGGGDTSGWSVSLGGDLDTEIGGSVAAVQAQTTSMESVAWAGDDHDSDESLTATYQYPMGEPATGQKGFLTFTVTLADGSTCSQDPPEVMVTADVSNADEGTYAATFAGALRCDGLEVDVEGWFRE